MEATTSAARVFAQEWLDLWLFTAGTDPATGLIKAHLQHKISRRKIEAEQQFQTLEAASLWARTTVTQI